MGPLRRSTSESDVVRPGPSRSTSHLVSLQDLVWFLYLSPVRRLASVDSPAHRRRLTERLETALQLLMARQKRRVAHRVAAAAQRGALSADPEEVARRVVSHTAAQLVADLCLAQPGTEPSRPAAIRGLPHLEEARARGKGVMLLSPHCYANRAAKRGLAAAGHAILSVRSGRLRYPGMSRAGQRLLCHRYNDFLHRVVRDEALIQDPGCSLAIFQRLRTGGLVDVHPDASPSGETVWGPFLGTRWRFPTGFLEIARLSGCAVVPMLCLWKDGAPEVEFDEPAHLDAAPNREAFVSANLPRLVAQLQAQVARHPDQWEYWAVREDMWIAGRG